MGIRKGWTMSPLFFLLVVEVFRKVIDGYKRNGNMKGVIMGKGLPLSHLLFVVISSCLVQNQSKK
jgi:hypothetical protein